MPKVIRAVGTDLSQGHCWLPMPPDVASIVGTVFVNGSIAMKVGDPYMGHALGCTVPIATTHTGIALIGSPDVWVDGQPIHRDADAISCGDVADNGSNDVFANGSIPSETIGTVILPPVFTIR